MQFKTLSLAAALCLGAGVAGADGDPTVAYEIDGKYYDANDVPTYNVGEDGAVDWYTFSGFRRYHSECHVCHGPDGEGSSYAPALKDSALDMTYDEFINVIVNGRQRVGSSETQVMPAFYDNLNVMCYLDDMYVYLRARGHEDVGRGRPAKREAKPDAFVEEENICMG